MSRPIASTGIELEDSDTLPRAAARSREMFDEAFARSRLASRRTAVFVERETTERTCATSSSQLKNPG